MNQTFRVDGMTCEHCAHAITDEVSALPSVESVHVDLAGASMSVISNAPIDLDELRAAVAEAGDYTIATA